MNISASSVASLSADMTLITAVQAAIEKNGPSLLFEPVWLAEILAVQFPAPSPAVSLLLRALDDHVPQQLLGAHTGNELQQEIAKLVKRFESGQSLSPAEARWAVETWASILHVAPGAVERGIGAEQVPLTQERGLGPPEAETAPAYQGTAPELSTARPHVRFATLAITLLVACVVGGVVWFNFFHRSLAIASIGASGPLVGDGSKHDVHVRYAARNVVVQGVEVRFVRGDVFGDDRTVRIAVPAGAARADVAAAGQIGLASSHPSHATFSYVLVGADGTRSAPVEKTFDFAAGPVRPPVIRSVAVPGELVTNKPFSLAIAFDAGTGSVGSVEMKIADQRAEAAAETVTTRLADLPVSQPGTLIFPVDPVSSASRRIVDFTLIDGEGRRSEPARVVLDVRRPAASPADCTAATCGRVVTATEVEPRQNLSGFFSRLFDGKGRAKKAYAISVRFDNGSTHLLQASSRWNPGARVRVVGRDGRLQCIEPDDHCR